MHNVRLKDYGNGKKQITLYLDPIVSTNDGLENELNKYAALINNDIFTEEQRQGFKKIYNQILSEIDKRDDLKDDVDLLDGKYLEFYEKCNENARLHSQLQNYKRAKNKIFDYARANNWEYFVTFTFSPEKVNRSDYDECKKKLTKWLNNMSNRFCGGNLKYLVVPELHSDGINYHFHGILSNTSGITFIPTGKVDDMGRTIYNIPEYKLGRFDATKVSSVDRINNYICKYCTKQIDVKLRGKRRYLASNNLSLPQEEKEYDSHLNEKIDDLKNDENVVFFQEKTYKIGNVEKRYMIFEIDERNNEDD